MSMIVVYDNLSHGRRGFSLATWLDKSVRGDIDSRLLQSVISEMDVVFHLAAKVSALCGWDPHF